MLLWAYCRDRSGNLAAVESEWESVRAVGDLVESREAYRTRRPVADKMFVAIEEFDQCALDVIIPLVPAFEREVFEAPFRFPLRHLSGDHSAGTFEREVPRAPHCG